MQAEHSTLTLHTVHVFDGELDLLNIQLLTMTHLLIRQLEDAMHALDYGNQDLALKVISRDTKVKELEVQVDNEIITIIARRSPVANDLRTVIASSKIVVEFERLGNELKDFAKLISKLYDYHSSDPTRKILADIVKIGHLIRLMLDKLVTVFETKDSFQAYELLQYDRVCENELQEAIKHQLDVVLQNARMTGRVLDMMHMMKALERCGEHCRHSAEHLIFMLDGIKCPKRDAPADDGF